MKMQLLSHWQFYLFFFFCLFFVSPPSALSQESKSELQESGLKAVYLFNFLQFASWPEEECMPKGEKVSEIAVIGETPINASLQSLKTELQKLQKTKITIRFLGPYTKKMDLSGCRLLFIAQSEKDHITDILYKIKDEPVLTVADSEECLDLGCMIALFSRLNKIRWAVNRYPLERAGLRLNSRLLNMAVKVINVSDEQLLPTPHAL